MYSGFLLTFSAGGKLVFTGWKVFLNILNFYYSNYYDKTKKKHSSRWSHQVDKIIITTPQLVQYLVLKMKPLLTVFRGFINFSATGFHKWAKLFGLKFSIRKTFHYLVKPAG